LWNLLGVQIVTTSGRVWRSIVSASVNVGTPGKARAAAARLAAEGSARPTAADSGCGEEVADVVVRDAARADHGKGEWGG